MPQKAMDHVIREALGTKINAVTGKWWLLLLRGLAAIVVSAVAFTHPGDALVALVLVLALYAIVTGVLAIFASIAGIGGDHWWAMLLEGILTVVAGMLIWSWPLASTVAFVYFFAAWLIVTGIFQIAGGVRLRNVIENEWFYIISGALSIAFGVWVFHDGLGGILATGLLVAWYFLFFGIMQVALSMRLRSVHAALSP